MLSSQSHPRRHFFSGLGLCHAPSRGSARSEVVLAEGDGGGARVGALALALLARAEKDLAVLDLQAVLADLVRLAEALGEVEVRRHAEREAAAEVVQRLAEVEVGDVGVLVLRLEAHQELAARLLELEDLLGRGVEVEWFEDVDHLVENAPVGPLLRLAGVGFLDPTIHNFKFGNSNASSRTSHVTEVHTSRVTIAFSYVQL